MMLKIHIVVICSISISAAQNTNNVCSDLAAYVHNISTNPNCWYDPDVSATPEGLAYNVGYLLERHKVRTEDGYILALFRLKSLNGLYGKEVIFLQHGMATDATCFMISKENSIAFFLANHGFDVWLGNFRGSEFNSHEQLSPDDPKYWDYSAHEHGFYDLSANFRYVSSKTKRKITYFGHSMGAGSMGIYASMRPDEAEQYIKQAILSAGTYYMRHTVGLTSVAMINTLQPILDFLPTFNMNVMMELNSFERLAFRRLCYSTFENLNFCLKVIEDMTGKSVYPFEAERFPMIFKIFKNASMKEIFHYIQYIRTGKYRMFDYGPKENMIRYNSEVPPDYNITAITIPVSLIYGAYDNVATKEDHIYFFETHRKPNWKMYETPNNHIDYLFSSAAAKPMFSVLLKIVNKNIRK